MDISYLGFLSSHDFEDGAATRGAILVTDLKTKPIEFRVSSPVRPSSFQKTLYGKILKEHILVELITLPLIHSLQKKPDILLVRDPIFLHGNSTEEITIIRIFREDESRYEIKSEPEQLASIGGQFETVLLETTENKRDILHEIRKNLMDIFKERSLLEPFDRLALACEQVHAKKIGDENASSVT
jgi:hypothetical protein